MAHGSEATEQPVEGEPGYDEPGPTHAGHGVSGTDHHDDHGAHGSEGDTWVLLPIVAGLVLGVVLVVVLGLGADVSPF